MKKKKQPRCEYHYQLLAPDGMAILLERGKEDEQMERLNLNPVCEVEKEQMDKGIMARRHIAYDTYCQDTPFAYK